MGVLRRRNFHTHSRGRFSFATATALAFLLFGCSPAVSLSLTRKVGGGGARAKARGWEALGRILSERRLGGPGSSPPSCRCKCGTCSPCKPVHVPIHPGFSTTLEYYPEAWRCKCGNKLFMP